MSVDVCKNCPIRPGSFVLVLLHCSVNSVHQHCSSTCLSCLLAVSAAICTSQTVRHDEAHQSQSVFSGNYRETDFMSQTEDLFDKWTGKWSGVGNKLLHDCNKTNCNKTNCNKTNCNTHYTNEMLMILEELKELPIQLQGMFWECLRTLNADSRN